MNNPLGSSLNARQSKTKGGVLFNCLKHLDYDSFISSPQYGCLAVPCPIELYAAWLAIWIAQGNEPDLRGGNFADASDWATPTRSTSLMVPEVWGDAALSFVVLSDTASIPGDPDAGHGDGQVLRLTYDRLHRLRASTTAPYKVRSYRDVTLMKSRKGTSTLLSSARRSIRNARTAIRALPLR